jgi:hypothetical protein
LGQPVPDFPVGGVGLGVSMLYNKQLLPAVLRIYRATGRGKEADAMAEHYLKMLRSASLTDWDPSLDLAALAANEGRKDEAVRVLKSAFDRYPLVFGFYPQLPWFRSLEGHPGYQQILAERKRRIEKAHAEMLQIEATALATALPAR